MGKQNRIDRHPWFNERTNGSFLILGSKKNKCGAGLGTSEADAGESCKQIKRDNTKAANGRYWITGCVVVQESHAPFSPPLPPPTRYVCARVLLRAQRERERERERRGGLGEAHTGTNTTSTQAVSTLGACRAFTRWGSAQQTKPFKVFCWNADRSGGGWTLMLVNWFVLL